MSVNIHECPCSMLEYSHSNFEFDFQDFFLVSLVWDHRMEISVSINSYIWAQAQLTNIVSANHRQPQCLWRKQCLIPFPSWCVFVMNWQASQINATGGWNWKSLHLTRYITVGFTARIIYESSPSPTDIFCVMNQHMWRCCKSVLDIKINSLM